MRRNKQVALCCCCSLSTAHHCPPPPPGNLYKHWSVRFSENKVLKTGGTGACSDAPAWLIFYDITIPKQNVRPELNKTKSMLRNIVKFTASLPNVLWEILTHQRYSSSPDISLLLPISISSTRPTGSSFLTAALHRHAHPPSLNECDKIGFWVPWGCFRG